LPKLQLIRQIQDIRARVVEAAIPQRKNLLGVDPHAVEIVRDGMRDVVNSGGGTGHGAGLSYTELCGKTGTAQWGPKAKSQRLAWFAGFLPYDNPRYAFAVLYEGRPGETVSGGRMAAPMVRKFFEGIKDDIKDEITPPKKALVVGDETAPKAEPVPLDPEGNEPPVAIPVEPLKALPVESFEAETSAPKEVSDVSVMEVPPARPRAMRAIPVGEDEVIQDNVEEP
jgi:penicillin-binding protein 2